MQGIFDMFQSSSILPIMYFQHSPDIWRDFPHLVAGTLVIDGLTSTVDATADVDKHFARARERLTDTDEGQLPEIEAWRKAYSQMGLKPTQYRCAAESLLRRFKKENSLPKFHPLVDLCNAFSLAFATPIAVYDTSKIKGGIEVRYATGKEWYLDFTGLREIPPAGEVIFADEAGHAHSRRWCYRQSKLSVIRPESTEALIVMEAHHATAPQDVQTLSDALTETLARLWKAPRKQQILTAGVPRLDF